MWYNVCVEIKRYIFQFRVYDTVHTKKEEDIFMSMTEPIRNKNQVKELAGYWLKRGQLRNYALIVLGVCTALRIGDLLRLEWENVYDENCGDFRTHITITEKKTGKQKTIALHKQAVNALRLLYQQKRGAYIFVSNRRDERAISRVQAWRIIRAAADAISLAGRIACHSLRKTFGYIAWKSGVHPSLIMDIFNHSSYEITRRYLGITQEDMDKVYLNMAVF